MSVNGVDLSELPEAPKTAESLAEFSKSSEKKKYSENIRSVIKFLVLSIDFFQIPQKYNTVTI